MPISKKTHKQLQQFFNKAVAGLAKQKWVPATTASGSCLYYDGATERRCAIGQLLTVAQAKKCPDGPVDDVETHAFVKKTLKLGTAGPAWRTWDSVGWRFLGELQSAHDEGGGVGVNDMRARLREVAHDYKLTLPKVLAPSEKK